MLLIKNLLLPNGKVVNFKLPSGSFMIIHGPNGTGKSLLLKSIALLEKIQFNEFTFEDRHIQEWKPEVYRSQVLYVPSTIQNLDLTVEDFLDFPGKLAAYHGNFSSEEAHKLARKFNLNGKRIGLLSMGQRQILALIRAVHLKAKVLLLDEPTSHLDPQMVRIAHELIKGWRERTGGSVVMVGHDEEEAKSLGTIGKQFNDFLAL